MTLKAPARQPQRWRTRIAVAALVAASGSLSAALPAVAATAPASTYYVDCSRHDGGSGSNTAPWHSLAQVNAHVAFTAGEKILLRRGTTCDGRLHPRGSGALGDPIVLGAYGSGTAPTVAGGGTPDRTGAIELTNQSNWTIQDLHVTNRGADKETNAYRSGVLLVNQDGGRLAGLTVLRMTVEAVVSNLSFRATDPREFGGIAAWTWAHRHKDSGFDGLLIRDNHVTNVGRSGIIVSNHGYPASEDRSIRIAYNTVRGARGDSIVVRGSVNARIDHNVSAGGGALWPCKQCGGVSPQTADAGIWPASSRNTLIEYNEVYGEHALGGDGEGLDADASAIGTVMQYNYIHDNQGGGILFCGSNKTTARFNILQNNQQGAITFINSIPATNTAIYNNTIYSGSGNEAKTVRSFGKAPSKTNRVRGVSFYNNLIFELDDSSWYLWPTTPKTRSNSYIGVHGIGEPNDVGKGWSNPGVRNPGSGTFGFGSLGGYKVTPNSSYAIGSPIPTSVTKDFFGKTINPLKPPRGAAG